jgi:DHA1 family bicyclomycin/chloramphenicol resistance-like MFS transporter
VKRSFGQAALIAACTGIGPMALNLYLPSLPLVQAEFSAGVSAVQITISLALLGFGLGLVFLGPLSDRHGRRASLLGGLLMFSFGSTLAMLAPSLPLLVAGRFLQSVGSALAYISARSVVSDVAPIADLPRAVAEVTLINVLVQAAAPLVGNGLISLGGWRATQLASALLGVMLAVAVYFIQPETRVQHARVPWREFGKGFLVPTGRLLRRPPFVLLILQAGLLYSAYPAFVTTAPHLMVTTFARPVQEFAWYFAFLPLGYLLGNLYVMHFGARQTQQQLILWGTGIAMASCLASFALLAAGVWHPLAMFLPAGLLLNFGLGLALPAVSSRAVLSSAPQMASGWGLIGFSYQVTAALAVQVLGYAEGASPYPVLFVCLGVVTAALLLGLRQRVA